MDDKRLKAIIAGAGIARLATAIALRQLPYVDVELYERFPELREIGASIALSPNGMRTLERLGVDNALDDEVAFRGPSCIPMIYRHWKTDEIVSTDRFNNVPDQRHQTTRYHRAHLQEALLDHVPRELIHLNKKVLDAQINEDKVYLSFEDGTTATGDLLIGADGINSKDSATSLLRRIPGLSLDSTHWWGPNKQFFASRLGKNQFTVVGQYDPTDTPVSSKNPFDNTITTWNDEGSVGLFRELFQDWNSAVKALTEAAPYVRRYPNYAGQHLSIWVFGSRVTLVGDAAHAHGGAHATGGSLALDDAYTLFLALDYKIPDAHGMTPSRDQLRAALDLYEATRRQHTDKLLSSVLASKDAPPAHSDAEIRAKIRDRKSTLWLTEHDVIKAFQATTAARTESQNNGSLDSRL